MKITCLFLLALFMLAQPKLTFAFETRQLGPLPYTVSNKLAAKLLPDISVLGHLAGAVYRDDPQGKTGHDPARSGFTLQEIEVALQSNIDPFLRADVFLGFSEQGVEIEEAFATTTALPKGLQIRAGKFFLPFGRRNAKHLEIWDFATNALPNKLLFGAEGLNETGVELNYFLPLPFFLQIRSVVSNGDNEDNFNGPRKQDLLYQERLEASFDVTDHTTILLGGSGAFGFNDNATGKQTQIFGGDLLIKWNPKPQRSLAWQSEYFYRNKNETSGQKSDGGFYSALNYQFSKRWHTGLRYDQIGLPSSLLAKEYRLTPALTFNPTEFSRLRLQYEFDKTQNLQANHATILQLSYSMGPHGAHPF